MRKFVFCTLASAAVLSIVIIDKATASPRQSAGLTATGNTTMGSMAGMRSALGPAIPLAHGLVQVQVTCMGSRILDVKAVQLPHDNNHSWDDSQHAAAVLRSEVLSKQTTDLHAVSGATYTSEGYLQSLNAALALAAPPAPKMSPTPVS